MSDYIKDESKVGAMLRYMTGDVALDVKKTLQELYIDPNVNDPEKKKIGEVCAKWHWRLVKYSPDPVLARKYISIIEFAYEYGIDLDTLSSWRKTMRIVVPEEFMYKMAKFTQVPQIAVMDDTHAEARKDFMDESRDSSDVLW